MQVDPAEQRQQFAENYRRMFDGELEELARQEGDLTEMAREVLHVEMSNRGLAKPEEKPAAPWKAKSAPSRFASDVDPGTARDEPNNVTGNEEDNAPGECTWKTMLCECETSQQALQLQMVLTRAGIDCWVSNANARFGGYPKVLVAADQLEQAAEIAKQPIPQEIVDDGNPRVSTAQVSLMWRGGPGAGERGTHQLLALRGLRQPVERPSPEPSFKTLLTGKGWGVKAERAARQQGSSFLRENSSNGGKAIRTFWLHSRCGGRECQEQIGA
jgi:hypothetical protein